VRTWQYSFRGLDKVEEGAMLLDEVDFVRRTVVQRLSSGCQEQI